MKILVHIPKPQQIRYQWIPATEKNNRCYIKESKWTGTFLELLGP
jgi:hypothetical protein